MFSVAGPVRSRWFLSGIRSCHSLSIVLRAGSPGGDSVARQCYILGDLMGSDASVRTTLSVVNHMSRSFTDEITRGHHARPTVRGLGLPLNKVPDDWLRAKIDGKPNIG